MVVGSQGKIDEIKRRCDLVDLVSEYIRLEKKGKNFVALCPFHQEKTPSFSVSPEKQLYYCFGCGEGGDHFKFIMNMENLPFTEALSLLAERTGVSISEGGKPDHREISTEDLFTVNQLAARFFVYLLHSSDEGKRALEYLKDRGITYSSMEMFQLGFATASWDGLLKLARKKGFSEKILLKAGLIKPRKDGKGYVDRFRNRIIFPISDLRGRVVGFGGRILEENSQSPKYLNSPETPIFDKGKYLYGLYQAKEALRKQGEALIVEGYTDVISLHQAGWTNAVATLGTALTSMQARLLRHQGDRVVMAFDADEGGKSATLRGLGILKNEGLEVKIAEFPPELDPDNFLREKGSQAFKSLLEGAQPLIDYQMSRLKKKHDLSNVEGKVRFGREFLVYLEEYAGSLEKDYYIRKASEELQISEEALRQEWKKARTSRGAQSRKEKREGTKSVPLIRTDKILDPAEELLLKLFLTYEGVFERLDEQDKDSRNNNLKFFSKEMQKIVEACRNLKNSGEDMEINALIDRMEEEHLREIITRAAFGNDWGELTQGEVEKMVDDCMLKLKAKSFREQRQEIEAEIKKWDVQGEREKVKELLQKWEEIKKAEKELHGGTEKERWS